MITSNIQQTPSKTTSPAASRGPTAATDATPQRLQALATALTTLSNAAQIQGFDKEAGMYKAGAEALKLMKSVDALADRKLIEAAQAVEDVADALGSVSEFADLAKQPRLASVIKAGAAGLKLGRASDELTTAVVGARLGDVLAGDADRRETMTLARWNSIRTNAAEGSGELGVELAKHGAFGPAAVLLTASAALQAGDYVDGKITEFLGKPLGIAVHDFFHGAKQHI